MNPVGGSLTARGRASPGWAGRCVDGLPLDIAGQQNAMRRGPPRGYALLHSRCFCSEVAVHDQRNAGAEQYGRCASGKQKISRRKLDLCRLSPPRRR
jgi:hypothetical protein